MAAKDERLELRCSTAERIHWEAAADLAGCSLSAWLREVATAEASATIDQPEPAGFLPGFGITEGDQ